MDAERELIVTPEMLSEGWHELRGMFITNRRFQVIRKLPDGNYVVLNPKVQQQEENPPTAPNDAPNGE